MIRVEDTQLVGNNQGIPAVSEVVLDEADLANLPFRAPPKTVDRAVRPNYEGLNLNVASD